MDLSRLDVQFIQAMDEYEPRWRKPTTWNDVPRVLKETVKRLWSQFDDGWGNTPPCPYEAFHETQIWDGDPMAPTVRFVAEGLPQLFWLIRDMRLYLVNTEGYGYCRHIVEVV